MAFSYERKMLVSVKMLYIGPHVSISKDISLSPARAAEKGAGAFAIFTKNQKIWKAKPLEESSIEEFKKNLARFGYSGNKVLAHAGYLINPATPDALLRKKSLDLLKEEISRCISLGLNKLNIHPGAFIEGEREDGIIRAASFFDEALEENNFLLSIENTSASGTNLGGDLRELLKLIETSKYGERMGVTLDTAHLYGYGYDVKNNASAILDDAGSLFGRNKIFGMHLNDSKAPLASRKDRHESIGKGLIGLDAFMEITASSIVQDKPLILETPDEQSWAEEIRMLTSAQS